MSEIGSSEEDKLRRVQETPITSQLDLPRELKPGESLIAPKRTAEEEIQRGIELLKQTGVVRPDIKQISRTESPLGEQALALPQPQKEIIREPRPEELEELEEAIKTKLYRGHKVLEVVNYQGLKGIKVQLGDNENDTWNFVPGLEQPGFILREIPPGKNWSDLQIWAKNRTRTAEITNEFSTEFIFRFREALADYDIIGSQPTPDERQELTRSMEVRGALAYAHRSVMNLDYDHFLEVWNSVLGTPDKHLTNLWNEKLGSPENVVQQLAMRMESEEIAGDRTTAGSYWREVQIGGIWPAGSKHAQVDSYLDSVFGTDEAKKAEARFITEKLFIGTGMATFYVGPVEAEMVGVRTVNHLVDLQIMAEADRELSEIPGAPDYVKANSTLFPETYYMRNFNYWKKWWQRRRSKVAGFPVDPTTGVPLSDPASGLRRVMYQPEEARRLGTSKARDLWYAGELYARPLPIWNGNKTLVEYMAEAAADKTKAVTYNYANAFTQGGKAVIQMVALFDEPIKGGRYAGDIDRLSNNLENITKLVETMGSYLSAGTTKQLGYFATAELTAAIFTYVNGIYKDKPREFNLWPQFDSTRLNLILNDPFFSKHINQEFLDQALNRLGASNQKVAGIRTNKATGGLFSKLGDAFGKAVTRR